MPRHKYNYAYYSKYSDYSSDYSDSSECDSSSLSKNDSCEKRIKYCCEKCENKNKKEIYSRNCKKRCKPEKSCKKCDKTNTCDTKEKSCKKCDKTNTCDTKEKPCKPEKCYKCSSCDSCEKEGQTIVMIINPR